MNALAIFLIVAFFVGSLVYLVKLNAARRNAWQAFAHERGLAFDPKKLSMAGVLDGHHLALFTAQRGSGKHSYTVAVVRVEVGDALPPDFTLAKEGIGDKILQFVAGSDEQVGVPEVDKRFKLKGLDARAVKLLRDTRVQRTLFEVADLFPALQIGNGVVQLETRRIPSNESSLQGLIDWGLTLARALARVA